jgi:hypothetical protein
MKTPIAGIAWQPISTILQEAPRNCTLLAWAVGGALPWGNLCLIDVPKGDVSMEDVDFIDYLDERTVFHGCFELTHWAVVQPPCPQMKTV